MGCEGQLFVWVESDCGQLNSTIENVTTPNGSRRSLSTDFYFALLRDNQRSGKGELRSFGRISRASQSSLVEALKLGAAEWVSRICVFARYPSSDLLRSPAKVLRTFTAALATLTLSEAVSKSTRFVVVELTKDRIRYAAQFGNHVKTQANE